MNEENKMFAETIMQQKNTIKRLTRLIDCKDQQIENLYTVNDNLKQQVMDHTDFPAVQPVYTVNTGYESLFAVLMEALDQSQNGKGKDRHASPDQSFEQQPIMTIQNLVGSGYNRGQAIKKIVESQRLGKDAAIAELLGAINYIAATVNHIRRETEL